MAHQQNVSVAEVAKGGPGLGREKANLMLLIKIKIVKRAPFNLS